MLSLLMTLTLTVHAQDKTPSACEAALRNQTLSAEVTQLAGEIARAAVQFHDFVPTRRLGEVRSVVRPTGTPLMLIMESAVDVAGRPARYVHLELNRNLRIIRAHLVPSPSQIAAPIFAAWSSEPPAMVRFAPPGLSIEPDVRSQMETLARDFVTVLRGQSPADFEFKIERPMRTLSADHRALTHFTWRGPTGTLSASRYIAINDQGFGLISEDDPVGAVPNLEPLYEAANYYVDRYHRAVRTETISFIQENGSIFAWVLGLNTDGRRQRLLLAFGETRDGRPSASLVRVE